jgi:hypothetical protein
MIVAYEKKAGEKLPAETESVPQGLKPRYNRNTCGTAEAVPLSKTDFSTASFAPRSLRKANLMIPSQPV